MYPKHIHVSKTHTCLLQIYKSNNGCKAISNKLIHVQRKVHTSVVYVCSAKNKYIFSKNEKNKFGIKKKIQS
jgi:hypothetical protein